MLLSSTFQIMAFGIYNKSSYLKANPDILSQFNAGFYPLP
jgi:hypothetical protein